ncbi:gamma carbonic anhydrase family protein [Anaerotardibacter muris]|uniref:gamma carbonic anhydrase family protein n=1 Tax=Anaerotardibacter muris TaxID=2941505 RepID=UPI0020414916|nr:gamma carbonic anhydrase family protein [Anaerotardibacter muris]
MNLHGVKLDPTCYLAPNCTLLGDVTIGAKSSVFPGVVIRADRAPVTIGVNSNIQDNATIHVDYDAPCIIGDNVSIGHNAVIHAATIGDNCIIGMNSAILDGTVVGRECTVGAGAVVPKGMIIPDGSLVLGVPAKIKGPASEAQRAHGQVSADGYTEHAQDLAKQGFFYTGATVPEDSPTIFIEPRYNYQCVR